MLLALLWAPNWPAASWTELTHARGVDRLAVQAFCGAVQAGVGGGAGMAVGPLGRQTDATLRVGRSGAALMYTYCITRGIFAGVPAP